MFDRRIPEKPIEKGRLSPDYSPGRTIESAPIHMNRTRILAAVLVVVVVAGSLGPVFAPATVSPVATDGQGTTSDRELSADGDPAWNAAFSGAARMGPSSVAVDSPAVTGGGLADSFGEFSTSELYGFAGYSRIDNSDPLENSSRRRIYESILHSPGTYPVELAESTSLSRSTVRYHVRVLEREGLITSEKVQGKRRYFPRETDNGELLVALRDDASRSVLTTLYRQGPATVSQLASELDRAPSTTSYHLTRLVELDLVEQSREDGAVVNRLAAETDRELVRRVSRGTPVDSPATTSD